MYSLDKEKKTKKSLSRAMILTTAILFSVYCFVLCPVYTHVCSDIVYSVTVLPEIIDFVITVVDVAVYAICFSLIIYSIYRFTLRSSGNLIAVFCASVFLKYTANFVITAILDGAISYDDISYTFSYFLIDVLLMSVIVFISNRIFKAHYQNGSKAIAEVPLLPFKRLFDLSNPLLASAFASGAVMALAKIATRVIYDIYVGLPSSLVDLLWMVVYYLLDVFTGLVIYAVSVICFTKIYEKTGTDE